MLIQRPSGDEPPSPPVTRGLQFADSNQHCHCCAHPPGRNACLTRCRSGSFLMSLALQVAAMPGSHARVLYRRWVGVYAHVHGLQHAHGLPGAPFGFPWPSPAHRTIFASYAQRYEAAKPPSLQSFGRHAFLTAHAQRSANPTPSRVHTHTRQSPNYCPHLRT